MDNNLNECLQIHNYSFAAIQAFVLEVEKHPNIYKGHQQGNIYSSWTKIVKNLLENGGDFILTQSERLYWERIYRGLWMWMRHILTSDMVAKYLGHVALSQNPKYVWLEYLKFLEPFIHLSTNSFNYDTDLDPFIYLQVLSSEEVARTPYCNYMVYWKEFEETLVPETFYISICVRTVEYLPSVHLKLELEDFLQNISDIEDVADIELSAEDLIAYSPVPSTFSNDSASEAVTNIIEEQLMTPLNEDEDYDDFLSGYISNIAELEE